MCSGWQHRKPIEAQRFVVRGRVQGVGFRWFVEREAHIWASPGGFATITTAAWKCWRRALATSFPDCTRACAKVRAPPAWMQSKSPTRVRSQV